PTRLSMPGLFPGRVVEAYHSAAIVNRRVSQPAVREMVERGMKALTGESAAKDAWARFVEPSDVVALKVNPSGTPPTTTSMPLVREVIQALNAIGVPNKNIIIYDRNSNQLAVNGCLKNLAYGTFDNVDRTHTTPKTYTDPVIAIMCTAGPIRSKAVLNIMDGIRAVYHSGPFAWNPEFVWEAKTLLFGTDPVAVDRIELEIVEKKRREVGAPSLWDRNPANLGNTADMQRTAH